MHKYHFTLIVCGLVLWEIVARLSLKFIFFFGAPSIILSSFFQKLFWGTLLYDFFITGIEVFVGFLIGMVCGSVVGFLLWHWKKLAQFLSPYILIMSILPVFAFAPIVIIWFGIGIMMKIMLVFFGTFFVALAQAYQGAENIEESYFQLLKTMKAKKSQVLRKLVLPFSISWVFASARLNIGLAIIGAFVGEFISSDSGLGHFMLRAGSLYDIPTVFAGAIMLSVLALLLFALINLLETKKQWILMALTVPKTS